MAPMAGSVKRAANPIPVALPDPTTIAQECALTGIFAMDQERMLCLAVAFAAAPDVSPVHRRSANAYGFEIRR